MEGIVWYASALVVVTLSNSEYLVLELTRVNYCMKHCRQNEIHWDNFNCFGDINKRLPMTLDARPIRGQSAARY